MSVSSGSECGPRSLGLLLSCQESGLPKTGDGMGASFPGLRGDWRFSFWKSIHKKQSQRGTEVFLQLSTRSEDWTGVWLPEHFTFSC